MSAFLSTWDAARTIAEKCFGNAQHFSLDTADPHQRTIAIALKQRLSFDMKQHNMQYVNVRISSRSNKTKIAAPAVSPQQVRFVYQMPEDSKTNQTTSATTSSTTIITNNNDNNDTKKLMVQKLNEKQRFAYNVHRQISLYNMALFVLRNSAAGTSEIIVLRQEIFARIMIFVYATVTTDLRFKAPDWINVVSMLLFYVQPPPLPALIATRFKQLPAIVTSFVLNVPHLEVLHAMLPQVAWATPSIDVAASMDTLYDPQSQDIMMENSVSMGTSASSSANMSDNEDSESPKKASFEESGLNTPSSSSSELTTAFDVEQAAAEKDMCNLLQKLDDDNSRANQMHGYLKQCSNVTTSTLRLIWFVAAFQQIFFCEADGNFDKHWSQVDMFYLLNLIQAQADATPDFINQRQLLGDERLFHADPHEAVRMAPRRLRDAVQRLIESQHDRIFINDFKTFDILVERVTRCAVEALYYSEGIFKCVPELVQRVNLFELLNRFQVRGTARERLNNMCITLCANLRHSNGLNTLKKFMAEYALDFEAQRIEILTRQSSTTKKLLMSPSDRTTQCITDVIIEIPLNNAICVVTPLMIDSTIRECCSDARGGIDYILVYTPLSMTNRTETEQHLRRQKLVPQRTRRSLDEDREFNRKTLLTKETELNNAEDNNTNSIADANTSSRKKPKQRKLKNQEETLAPPHMYIAMSNWVWRSVESCMYSTILMQRSRARNEYAVIATKNRRLPLCGIMVAETLSLYDTASLESLCAALNSFYSLCGGSNCEWMASSLRARYHARSTAKLLLKLCTIFSGNLPASIPVSLLLPLADLYDDINAIRRLAANEDDDNASFFSLAQLVLNGSCLPIGCTNDIDFQYLRNMVSIDDAWTNYFNNCVEWSKMSAASLDNRYDAETSNNETCFACECGGATKEECENMLKNNAQHCCVCTSCTSAPLSDEHFSAEFKYHMNIARRNEIVRKNLCKWCQQRLPLNGMVRAAGSKMNNRIGLPPKILYTLFDINDPRRPDSATFTNFFEFLWTLIEAEIEKAGDVVELLSKFRFDIRGAPSRVPVPRCGPDRQAKTHDIENKFKIYAQSVAEKQYDSDVLAIDDYMGKETLFFEQLSDTRLRDALMLTWELKEQPTTKTDPDEDYMNIALGCTTEFLSVTQILMALEIMSFISRRSIHHMCRLNDIEDKVDFETLQRCLIALFVPIRTFDEALMYRRRIRENFSTFPVCRPVFAEATAFEKRSVTTLISNQKRSLETTLDNMFFNKIIERPAALAVPGLLEFLFINSTSIDATGPVKSTPKPDTASGQNNITTTSANISSIATTTISSNSNTSSSSTTTAATASFINHIQHINDDHGEDYDDEDAFPPVLSIEEEDALFFENFLLREEEIARAKKPRLENE